MTRGTAQPVITGLGVAAPNGVGRASFAKATLEGISGIGDLVSFDAGDTGRERAGEMPDFDAEPFLRSPKNYLDRNSALAFAACEMAVRQSGASLPDETKAAGMCFGSAGGNLESLSMFWERLTEKGPRFAPPFLFPHTYQNTTLGLLCIEYGLGGPHECFCTGGAAGLEAVAAASQAVRLNRAPLMLAGGAEAFSEWLFRLALARGWLSPLDGGAETCRPFGNARNGCILGEGAAACVIEPESAAAGRALARIAGYGAAAGPEAAMRMALENARIAPGDVGGVFAAAAGLPDADQQEADALVSLFGPKEVPVVALKALIGETLGASGPLNLAAALSALETNTLPAVPFPEGGVIEGVDLVTTPRGLEHRALLINARGIMGTVTLIVE